MHPSRRDNNLNKGWPHPPRPMISAVIGKKKPKKAGINTSRIRLMHLRFGSRAYQELKTQLNARTKAGSNT